MPEVDPLEQVELEQILNTVMDEVYEDALRPNGKDYFTPAFEAIQQLIEREKRDSWNNAIKLCVLEVRNYQIEGAQEIIERMKRLSDLTKETTHGDK